MLNNIELLIFDLDGTLIDSTQAIYRSINASLKSQGFSQAPLEQIQIHIGQPLNVIYEHIMPGISEQQIISCIQVFERIYADTHTQWTHLHPYVEEVLTHYKGKKKLSIATTKSTPDAIMVMKDFGLHHQMDAIFGGDLVQRVKPDPEIIQLNLNHFGIEPKHAVMIGDTTMDIDAGTAAGVYTVAVTTGTHSRQQLEVSKPTYIIESLSELIDIV